MIDILKPLSFDLVYDTATEGRSCDVDQVYA